LEIGYIVGGSLGTNMGDVYIVFCKAWFGSSGKWAVVFSVTMVIERNMIEKDSELMYPQGLYVNFISNNISKVFSYGIMV